MEGAALIIVEDTADRGTVIEYDIWRWHVGWAAVARRARAAHSVWRGRRSRPSGRTDGPFNRP